MKTPSATHVIVLNGGSSSGKSGISRCLQTVLADRPWLRFGVDDLVDRLPPSLMESGTGVAFGQQGEVTVGAVPRDGDRVDGRRGGHGESRGKHHLR